MPVEGLDNVFMPLDLDVPVGVDGLRDRRMPELALHPPDVRPRVQQPCRVAVPGRVVFPIRELGAGQQGLPDPLLELGVPDGISPGRGEHELPLLGRPILKRPVEVDRLEV
jgi:hypothetical protein